MTSDREFDRRIRRLAQLRAMAVHRMSARDHAELERLENWQADLCRTLPRQIERARHRLARHLTAAATLGLI